jgi:hypothetical protein
MGGAIDVVKELWEAFLLRTGKTLMGAFFGFIHLLIPLIVWEFTLGNADELLRNPWVLMLAAAYGGTRVGDPGRLDNKSACDQV